MTTVYLQPSERLQAGAAGIESITCVAYSPQGQHIAIGGNGRGIQVWEMPTRRLVTVYRGHSRNVRALAFSPDGTMIASGGDDSTAQVWETLTGRQLWTHAFAGVLEEAGLAHQAASRFPEDFPPEEGYAVRALAWSPDGKHLAVGAGSSGYMHILCAVGGSEERVFGGGMDVRRVKIVVWTVDGELLVSADDDYTLRLYDVATGEQLVSREMPHAWRGMMTLAPDGRQLALGFGNGDVRRMLRHPPASIVPLYDAFSLSPYAICNMAFSPGGRVVASVSLDGTLQLWNAGTGEVLDTIAPPGMKVRAVAFSPGGSMLAAGVSAGYVQLWRVQYGGDAQGEEQDRGEILTLAAGDTIERTRRPFLSPTVAVELAGELNGMMGLLFRVEEVHEEGFVAIIPLEEGRRRLHSSRVTVPRSCLISTHFRYVQEE